MQRRKNVVLIPVMILCFFLISQGLLYAGGKPYVKLPFFVGKTFKEVHNVLGQPDKVTKMGSDIFWGYNRGLEGGLVIMFRDGVALQFSYFHAKNYNLGLGFSDVRPFLVPLKNMFAKNDFIRTKPVDIWYQPEGGSYKYPCVALAWNLGPLGSRKDTFGYIHQTYRLLEVRVLFPPDFPYPYLKKSFNLETGLPEDHWSLSHLGDALVINVSERETDEDRLYIGVLKYTH